jgi:hypothetical protein
MAQIDKGQQSDILQLQAGWTLTEDYTNTLNGSATFVVTKANAFTRPPKMGDPHPYNKNARILSVSLVGNATHYDYNVQYFGLSANPSRPIYSYYSSLSEEPIETHPNFADFAGDAATPLNNAVFDKDGLFLGFGDGAGNDLTGVRGYLTGSPAIRKTFFTTQVFSGLEDIGDTRQIRAGVIPGLSSDQNALKTNWSSRPLGLNYYEVTEEFLLSGMGSWNPIIYEESNV